MVKVVLPKVGVGLNRRGEFNKEIQDCRLA